MYLLLMSPTVPCEDLSYCPPALWVLCEKRREQCDDDEELCSISSVCCSQSITQHKTNTYWTFPTISNNFSWITFITSKLKSKHRHIRRGDTSIHIKHVGVWCMNVPFIWCDWIHQNVTVDVYRVSLWEDWVFILHKHKHKHSYQHHHQSHQRFKSSWEDIFHVNVLIHVSLTWPAVSTSCSEYSCPLTVIILVNADDKHETQEWEHANTSSVCHTHGFVSYERYS